MRPCVRARVRVRFARKGAVLPLGSRGQPNVACPAGSERIRSSSSVYIQYICVCERIVFRCVCACLPGGQRKWRVMAEVINKKKISGYERCFITRHGSGLPYMWRRWRRFVGSRMLSVRFRVRMPIMLWPTKKK